MQDSVAIYRPDDIPTAVFDWDVSFKPLIEMLEQMGFKPSLPQRRLHPDWREEIGEVSARVFDVLEIPLQQFVDNRDRLLTLGFDVWPEQKDAVSELYNSQNDQQDNSKLC